MADVQSDTTRRWHDCLPCLMSAVGICLWAIVPPYTDDHWQHVLWAMIGAVSVYANWLLVQREVV